MTSQKHRKAVMTAKDEAGMVEEDGEDGEDEATDIGAAGRQQRQRGWQSGGEGQATA